MAKASRAGKKKPPPRRRRRLAHPPALIAPADAFNSITLLVGQIGGKLETHIEAVMQDRAERENDRHDGARYRQEVRDTLANLKTGVDKIAGLSTRLDAVEKVTGEFKTFRNRAAGALGVITLLWPIAVDYIKRKFFA
jgi:hypothetical protein